MHSILTHFQISMNQQQLQTLQYLQQLNPLNPQQQQLLHQLQHQFRMMQQHQHQQRQQQAQQQMQQQQQQVQQQQQQQTKLVHTMSNQGGGYYPTAIHANYAIAPAPTNGQTSAVGGAMKGRPQTLVVQRHVGQQKLFSVGGPSN
jgi:phage-related minor tail protein